VFEILCKNGLEDLAYKIMNQQDLPSFGYWVKQGSTTTWENWEGTGGSGSHNHPMFGSGLSWFYRDLAGLRPTSPGFKSFEVKPVTPEGLDWVEYSHDTTYGRIKIRWERKGDSFTLDCTVPVGTTATIHVPSKDGYKVHEVESGKYNF
jgi:alpha-L-rhamnosidase